MKLHQGSSNFLERDWHNATHVLPLCIGRDTINCAIGRDRLVGASTGGSRDTVVVGWNDVAKHTLSSKGGNGYDLAAEEGG